MASVVEAQSVAITSHVYGKLEDSLDPLGQVPKPTGQQPCLKHCPPPVEAFTGRQDVLGQMRDFFFDGSRKRHVFVLHGLGGAGKTQIALKFVEICQDMIVPRSPRFPILASVFLDLYSCFVQVFERLFH